MITDFNQLDLTKSYTYADYLTWQFDEMVEIIKGKVPRMDSSPSTRHQTVRGNLQYFLTGFLRKKPSSVFAAPFDVRFVRKTVDDKEIITVTQPDLCVICDPAKIDERGCLGAPDFIIEILSPSSATNDAHTKFHLYEEFGVGEYWIVSPNDRTVDVFLLENEKYAFKGKFVTGDLVSVYTLQGLEINLMDVFE